MTNLSKFDAARAQLVTAIRLLFDDRDPISVYTLATNAQEILSTLCDQVGVRSLRSHISRPSGMTDAGVQKGLINPLRNFFKHADHDPHTMWKQFQDEDCDHILIIACHDILELEKKSPIEAQVFLTWYGAVYPDKIPDGSDWKKAAQKKFPNIIELDRIARKKRAAAMIDIALKHRWLLEHPETDIREIDRWK